MSQQKNEAPILILSFIITLVAIGFGVTWGLGAFNFSNTSSNGSSSTNTSEATATDNPESPSRSSVNVQAQLSTGDRILVSSNVSPQKQAGISAMAAGNYSAAVQSFETALAANRNDPEALIYLNNARIAEQPAHTLAVAAPISSATDAAEEILRGVAQAQTAVNQSGGIQGTPLKIVIVNDNNDADTAVQLAQELVNRSDILAIIGHFSSDITIQAGAVYQDAGLPMISPTSTSVEISGLGNYIFRTVQSDRISADGLARHMLSNMNVQSAAVFYNSESGYSNSLKDAFTSAVLTGGGQVTSEFDLSSDSFNAITAVEQAIQQGAQALMLAANTPTRSQALDVIAANQQRLALLGGDSLYNAELLQRGGQAAVGMVVAAPWNRDANPNSSFPQEARQLWGGDVSWRTAMTYDAMQALIAAIAQNPTRSGIQQTLSGSGFSATGASGTIQFLPSGDRNQAPQLVIVQPSTETAYGYGFEPAQGR